MERRLNKKPSFTPHLMDYYRVLQKHKGIIFAAFLLTVVFTGLLSSRAKPVYEASSRLIIDTEKNRSPVTGAQMDFISQQMDVATHVEIITSRPVLETVLRRIEQPHPSSPSAPSAPQTPFSEESFLKSLIADVKTNLKRLITAFSSSPQTQRAVPTEEDLLAAKIAGLRGTIKVEQVRNTHLLGISVQNQDPVLARDIANAVAETYILYDSGTRLTNSRKMLDWLSDQLYQMKKNVEDAEMGFLKYKQNENLFSMEGKQKLNVQKIEDMNKAYIDARTQRLELEAIIEELRKFINNEKKEGVRSVPTFYRDSLIQSLYSELLAAEVEYSRISGLFKAKHPEMLKVTGKISELRSKIRQELKKAMDNAESELAILTARESALQQVMQGFEKEAIDTTRKEVQYTILEREVDTNREIYDALMSKIKETDLLFGEMIRPNMRLIEPAFLPSAPIKPNMRRNLMMGVIMGLITGAGFAFLVEYMDRTFRTKDNVEQLLNVAVLSEIPLEGKASGALIKRRGVAQPYPTILNLPMHSHFSEAFRGLATNLRFSEFHRRKGVYLITSSVPQEGKTTVSLNLGLTLAQLGVKTLIIEADLRVPSLRKVLGLDQESGLTDILVDTFSTQVESGVLGELKTGDLHKLLEVQEKSGILYYHSETDVFTITFHKGQMLKVEWPTRPGENHLLSILTQTGKIAEKQAKVALEKAKTTSQPFEHVLIDLGFFSAEELAGPLKLQRQENLKALHDCRNAQFIFKESDAVADPEYYSIELAIRAAVGPIEEASRGEASFLLRQIGQYLHRVPECNLWVLPGGKTPSNPVELLMSNRMRVLVDLLKQQFDIVILDSPPVATISDTPVLTSLSDGVVLVIKSGMTPREVVMRAREQLEVVQSTIIGAVVNMLDYKKDPYYYRRYYSKYDYYYRSQDKPQNGKGGEKIASLPVKIVENVKTGMNKAEEKQGNRMTLAEKSTR